jgi:hypothetical protein
MGVVQSNLLSSVGQTKKEVLAWTQFHKTGKCGLIENATLLNYSHMKRLSRNCHNTKLSRMVSHNFSSVWDAAIFNPENRDRASLRNVSIDLRVYTKLQP